MQVINRFCAVLLVVMIVYSIARRQEKSTGSNANVPARDVSDRNVLRQKHLGQNVLGRSDILVWGFLLAAFVGIRLLGLGAIPGGINQDEAMGAVDALALSRYATDRFGMFLPAHFTAWGFGQMSVLLSYFMVPFIKIFGFETITVRLPIFLLSLAGAAAVCAFVKQAFGEKTACITFAFLLINPWHFMQGRWSLDCNAFPHVFLIGFCLLSMGLKKARYLYLSMIFFALSMYAYGVSFFLVPVFLLSAGICLLLSKKVRIRQCLLMAAIYFGISFPIYGTMLINFMKWDTVRLPFVTMPYFKDTIRGNDILFFSENVLQQLGANLKALFRVAFLQKPDLIWNAMDDFGTMYQVSLPLILFGFVTAIHTAVRGKEEKQRILCRLLVLYWGSCVIQGCCINQVNVNRINAIFYCHIIFAGMGIAFLARRQRAVFGITAGIFLIQGMLFFNRYFTVWADQIEDYFYSDFVAAVEFAGQQQGDYYCITPDTQYEGSARVSEILTEYALKIDAKYYQGETNAFMGNEIPYADRFHFVNPDLERLSDRDDIIYVVRTENVRYYPAEAFWIKNFGSYSVAVPE